MPLVRLPKSQLASQWFLKLLVSIVQQGPIPRHIAIIADGNRRYAKSRGFSIKKGHTLGADVLNNVLDLAFETGVEFITAYLFSIENFKRPKNQVDDLMGLFEIWILKCLYPSPNKRKLRFRFLGRLELFPNKIRKLMKKLVEKTANCDGATFNICVAYTSRDEMARAIETTVRNHNDSPQSENHITAEILDSNMDINEGSPLDILIRTSGVGRLSDFLLWQCHRDTVIEVLDMQWPAFQYWDLFFVILRWQRKKMARMGFHTKVVEEPRAMRNLVSNNHLKWLMSVILLLAPAVWGFQMAFHPEN
ncbi:dehydrodolichyl diphosphate synthase [Nannizzia gypsea CBS 118893]|uniref:Alkyl transferase n=1 Tax=Arthroderma gypseum (strain ATCC MYA-4604 / CBS 118893) TaxID=535722 RepID=E5QZU9_ARTGP|nr:dehydrodolichyl diphosphate synthase [Nannizzia gypsea CBS 118893]EFQ97412.1 dehydrodolichyl diphosphate synthase [Nannizzia gypsea CBS 118893]